MSRAETAARAAMTDQGRSHGNELVKSTSRFVLRRRLRAKARGLSRRRNRSLVHNRRTLARIVRPRLAAGESNWLRIPGGRLAELAMTARARVA